MGPKPRKKRLVKVIEFKCKEKIQVVIEKIKKITSQQWLLILTLWLVILTAILVIITVLPCINPQIVNQNIISDDISHSFHTPGVVYNGAILCNCSNILIFGTASSNVGLYKIECLINDGNWTTEWASCRNCSNALLKILSWNKTVNLSPGMNSITVQITNNNNQTKIETIYVICGDPCPTVHYTYSTTTTTTTVLPYDNTMMMAGLGILLLIAVILGLYLYLRR